MPSLHLLFHTVRHLKPQQAFFRLFYRFRTLRNFPPQSAIRRSLPPPYSWPAYKHFSIEGGEIFTFLNTSGDLAGGWNNPGYTKLWLYKLHYLDDLTAIGSGKQTAFLAELVLRWIRENPSPQGNGWEPYPLSLRIVNLVKFLSGTATGRDQEIVESLALQAEALRKQKEGHLLGNHYFANGKALVFAGVFFEGSDPRKWLRDGLQILDSEVKEQFLKDGAHFELSPMYHCILLWDLCDLIKLARWSNITELLEREELLVNALERGIQWLRAMTHPDGEISFFNDAVLGEAPKPADIESYAKELGLNSAPARSSVVGNEWSAEHLATSGYVSVTNARYRHRAIADLAQIGPDYLPGHGHADTLSFELSLYGQRVLVNSGTSHYEASTRLFERSTAAHNTVEVDGVSSSEIWDNFKVARRARPQNVKLKQQANGLEISGAHTGYRRLPGKVTHHRVWDFQQQSITIEDQLDGRWQKAVAHYYCHPSIKVQSATEHTVVLTLTDNHRVSFKFSGAKSVTIVDSCWNRAFGESLPNSCVQVEFGDRTMRALLTW